MRFARAVPTVNLLAISIKLAISIYFDCAPAISIAISIISIYFDLFRSISIISIYFDQFDLFRSISIHFDSDIEIAKTFRWRAGHFDRFITSQQRWRMMAAVCHLTLASFTPIMQEYDISSLI